MNGRAALDPDVRRSSSLTLSRRLREDSTAMRIACVFFSMTVVVLLSVIDSAATTPPNATVTMHWRVAPCFANKHLLCSGAPACNIQTIHRCATFASACYPGDSVQGTSTSAFLAETAVGQSRFSESGHLSISGFSLDWKGKINGPGPGGSGTGRGRLRASHRVAGQRDPSPAPTDQMGPHIVRGHGDRQPLGVPRIGPSAQAIANAWAVAFPSISLLPVSISLDGREQSVRVSVMT